MGPLSRSQRFREEEKVNVPLEAEEEEELEPVLKVRKVRAEHIDVHSGYAS